jgi:hypothetical protein
MVTFRQKKLHYKMFFLVTFDVEVFLKVGKGLITFENDLNSSTARGMIVCKYTHR